MSRDISESTLAQFDIIGCFFINKFYSHLYGLASAELSSGRAKTLTDAYRDLIVAYVRGVGQPATYLQTLKELIQYWSQLTTGFQTTITDFEDKILIEFIPPEYFREFTSKDRETVLQKIIGDAVAALANECVKMSMLSRIIDAHTDESNVSVLQQKMIQHFTSVRNGYYERFVQEISRSNRDANSQIIDALKAECVSLTRRCVEAEAQRDKLQKMLTMALDKMDELKRTHRDDMPTVVATPKRVYADTEAQPRRATPLRIDATEPPTPKRVTPLRADAPTSEHVPMPKRVTPLRSEAAAPVPAPIPTPVHTVRTHALTTPMRVHAGGKGLTLSDLLGGDESPTDDIADAVDVTTETVDVASESAPASAHNDDTDSEEEFRRQQEQLEAKLAEL